MLCVNVLPISHVFFVPLVFRGQLGLELLMAVLFLQSGGRFWLCDRYFYWGGTVFYNARIYALRLRIISNGWHQ
jgi:hypothetical protein